MRWGDGKIKGELPVAVAVTMLLLTVDANAAVYLSDVDLLFEMSV